MHALAARQAQFARDTGALLHLQLALSFLARSHLLAGELTTAALMIEEDRLIAEATGNPPLRSARMMLAAWRGQEARGVGADRGHLGRRRPRTAGRRNAYASSVLYNGLGRHDAARDAAWQAFERDPIGAGPFLVPELAEAASRTGDVALVRAALEWLSERTRVTPTEWALGIEARVRALLSEGDVADSLYRESIDAPAAVPASARSSRARHLLYGEWLRRERRRVDAREQLRTAHEMLDDDGHRRVRRARPARAAGHRRDRPQTHRRNARRAHRPGDADRAARPRRTLEPGDRHPAVHQSAHRQVPPAQGLHQARHRLTQRARPRPAERPVRGPAALARPRRSSRAARSRLPQPRCPLADANDPAPTTLAGCARRTSAITSARGTA